MSRGNGIDSREETENIPSIGKHNLDEKRKQSVAMIQHRICKRTQWCAKSVETTFKHHIFTTDFTLLQESAVKYTVVSVDLK